MKILPRTLFGRTAATIAFTLLVFLVVAASATVQFVLVPMAKRSAEDLAAEIVAAAQSLPYLPDEQKARYVDQLMHDHEVVVADTAPEPRIEPAETPYLNYFRDALVKHSIEDFNLSESDAGETVWVNMLESGNDYHFGFRSNRLGINPPLTLLLVLGCGALLTIVASVFEVRRITKPLDDLASAADELGQGRTPAPVHIKGPREIENLADTFNQMSANLKHTAENRTVMIAGISHDLRTPLTRLNLAAEMLEDDSNRDLVQRIRRNLRTINDLVDDFLAFSRGIETSNPERLQLWEVVEALLVDLKPEGVDVRLNRCEAPETYFTDRKALSRVLANLLKNALQYGQGKPVDVDLACTKDGGLVEIADRGPGIPADKVDAIFEPFYRLEDPRLVRSAGSGLGLAIARQLARKHGWKIEMMPREGGGTIARLILPPASPLIQKWSALLRADQTAPLAAYRRWGADRDTHEPQQRRLTDSH